jgi:hypothetical protein
MLHAVQGASRKGVVACCCQPRPASTRVAHVTHTQGAPAAQGLQLTGVGAEAAACQLLEKRSRAQQRTLIARASAAAQPVQEASSWDAVYAGQALPTPYTSPSLEVRDVPGEVQEEAPDQVYLASS